MPCPSDAVGHCATCGLDLCAVHERWHNDVDCVKQQNLAKLEVPSWDGNAHAFEFGAVGSSIEYEPTMPIEVVQLAPGEPWTFEGAVVATGTWTCS